MRPLDEPTTPAERRWSLGRLTVVVLVIGMVAMWGYVVYLAFGPGRADPPNRLDDPTFAGQAQQRCRSALAEVALLPRAVDTGSARERAAVIVRANGYFEEMLDDLDRLVPEGEDGELVTAWLGDWRTYLGDRQAFASALRTDPEAQLLVSAKDRDQVTQHIDAFAADNDMPACGTPLDV